ncbi:MAG: hypothetical protein HC880_17605 [Bacteroidia bacterium]|nr:hypothetical protein [Bacteroidia bacterium]
MMIPNKEVRILYKDFVRLWFQKKMSSEQLRLFLEALTQGKPEQFKALLQLFAEQVFSYHDLPGQEAEGFYHAFVLGLLINLEGRYEIKSNRESGSGRYDIALTPKKNDPLGVILEFKGLKLKSKTRLDAAAAKALTQIEEKNYASEMRQRGVGRIFKIGVAARGKKVDIKSVID